jgi:methionine-rich copper-binding protein CopC
MIRRFRAVLAAMVLSVVAAVGFSSVAYAHSDEFISSPANGSVVADVSELQFTFVEPVEQSFPPEVVLTSAGAAIALGAPTFDASGATMTVPITQGNLPNGNYTAVYRIVSIDGHPASGEVNFTVEGSSAEPVVISPTEPAVVETAEPAVVEDVAVTYDMARTTSQDDGAAQIRLVLGIAAAVSVVLALAIVIAALRGRRNIGRK